MIKKQMERVKEIIKDEKGEGYILTCVIVLSVMMLFLIGFQFVRVTTIGNGIKDSLENSIRRTVTTNWDDAFPGGRQGYTGAYTLSSDSFYEMIDSNDIMEELKDLLALKKNDAIYEKVNDGEIEYQLKDLELDINNSSFATDSSNQFSVYASIQVKITMSFLGNSYPVEFPLKIKTAFSPLF